MFTHMKKFSAAVAVSLMLAPVAASAAGTNQDIVRDERCNVVMDSNGGCVLTKWTAASTECNPGMANVPAALKKVMVSREERTVYFDFNKADLNAESKQKLGALINAIHSSKQVVSVDIVGHADQIGSASYNNKLSMKRAVAVKDYLAKTGKISTRNVELRALGSSKPVTSCDAKLPRAKKIACMKEDRRVEVELNLTK
jgi:outer membrane protein OmpA-like peptidoglycan-associated protein